MKRQAGFLDVRAMPPRRQSDARLPDGKMKLLSYLGLTAFSFGFPVMPPPPTRYFTLFPLLEAMLIFIGVLGLLGALCLLMLRDEYRWRD